MNACEKPLIWRGKCAVQRSSITTWRWLTVFFMWIATPFRSFLKFNINYFRHSTQLSSLVIPAKRQLNGIECSLPHFYFYVHIGLFQLALRAIWINLTKNLFRTTHKIDVLHLFKSNEVAAQLSHTSEKKIWLSAGAVVLFRQRVHSDERRKTKENFQIWNNFGPRSPTVGGRGRPPFVENIAKNCMPHSLPL